MTAGLEEHEFHLACIDRAVDESPPDQLPVILGRLEAAKARAWARLMVPPVPEPAGLTAAPEPVKLLTPDQAAALVQKPSKWLLRRTRGKNFRRNLSRKCIRFEEAGFRRWLASQR